jgi:glucose/arabinose dehydrogenase
VTQDSDRPTAGTGEGPTRSIATVALLALLGAACAATAPPEPDPSADDVEVIAADEELTADVEDRDDGDDADDAGSVDADDDGDGDRDDEAEAAPELDPLRGLTLEAVADGFDGPIGVALEPGAGRLAVLERTGRAWLVAPDGQRLDAPLVDLRDQLTADSIEQGLLGLAYHPAWPGDDRVFLYHSLPGNDNALVSYRSAGGDHAQLDPATRQELVRIVKQPDMVRHNGGHVLFGPDGLLYVSVGDGARASVNGQDPGTLLGTILRLDVDEGDPYTIPADNPFADGRGGAPEVWWYGLRNPWRFSIDATSGLVLIGDVGQESIEEVNVVPLDAGGLNFGWPIREGTSDFYGGDADGPLTDPVLEITHDEPDRGCSLTGGVVSRDPLLPELDGRYWYADWCHGWIRSALLSDGALVDIEEHTDQLPAGNVASFGVDAAGSVLVVDWGGGTVSRIVGVR